MCNVSHLNAFSSGMTGYGNRQLCWNPKGNIDLGWFVLRGITEVNVHYSLNTASHAIITSYVRIETAVEPWCNRCLSGLTDTMDKKNGTHLAFKGCDWLMGVRIGVSNRTVCLLWVDSTWPVLAIVLCVYYAKKALQFDFS